MVHILLLNLVIFEPVLKIVFIDLIALQRFFYILFVLVLLLIYGCVLHSIAQFTKSCGFWWSRIRGGKKGSGDFRFLPLRILTIFMEAMSVI